MSLQHFGNFLHFGGATNPSGLSPADLAIIVEAKSAAIAAQAAAEDKTGIASAVWAAGTRKLTGSGSAAGLGPTVARAVTPIYATCFAKSTLGLFARILAWDGDDLLQADVTSVAYTVYVIDPEDKTDRSTVVAGHSGVVVDKATCLFDTLQSDEWASNYNFKHIPSIATHQAFAEVGTLYLVEYTMTLASGEPIVVQFVVNAAS
jgi:hypothetical protein